VSLGVYRVTEKAKRVSMRQLRPHEKPYHDPREQAVDMDSARAAVRAERLRDLERLWAEGYFGTFEHLIVLWHRMDHLLFLQLPTTAAKYHAARLLHDEGLL
jgi:hypothetical protein